MKSIKQELYKLCQTYIQQRILTAKQAIEAAQQAANNETKSSSGDKYETGRAMMQLEIEKDSAQLSESLKLKHMLDQINIDKRSTCVQAGSLVVTNQGVFFIAISVGKLSLHGKTYFAVSPASPMGVKLMGLIHGQSYTLNNCNYVVQEIQ